MRFTDSIGRKIETRSGEDVTTEAGFPIVELFVDGEFVDSHTMLQFSSENVSAVEDCLFEEHGIEM